METIENGLIKLDQHNKDAIEKHNSILMKTIFDLAHKSQQSATSFDNNFKKLFPELVNLGIFDEENFNPNEMFNPHTVCEFRDGKAYQVIESWDKYCGILPNRRVMSKYYLREGHVFTPTDTDIMVNNYKIWYCDYHSKVVGPTGSPICGCGIGQTNNTYIFPTVSPKHKRGEERYNFFHKTEQEFEVDNYLNLYHVPTGLYLMFNKTVFSDFPFCLAKMYLSSRDTTFIENSEFDKEFIEQHPFYQIFMSKRLNTGDLTFKLNKSNYESKDARDVFLKEINQLVPDDYLFVYNLFNRFRQFDGFSSNFGSDNILELESGDADYLDEKDRLIKAFQSKLRETVSRAEEAEKVVSDMTDDYSKKSIQVQSLNRELNLSQLKLEEQRQKYETNNKEIIVDKVEELSRECFSLKKRLLESSVFKIQAEKAGESLNSFKKDNEQLSLDVKRLKDMNRGLVECVSSEKSRNDDITKNNKELLNSIGNANQKTSNYDTVIAKMGQEIKQLEKSNKSFADKLGSLGDASTNVLERALGDQMNDLQARLSDAQKSNVDLESKNRQLTSQIDRYQQLVSAFKV